MHVQITARQFKATDSLRDHIMERIPKLDRYFDGITNARVVLEQGASSTDEHIAEVSIHVYRQLLTAREAAATHEEAVNQCVGNLKRQILRYKDKLRRKHKYKEKPEISIEPPVEPTA